MSTNLPSGPRKPATRWSSYGPGTWGPYWEALFGPATVTGWINWKRGSTGVGVARRLWEQREHLRRTYESVYGADPAAWLSQHPGVILDAVSSSSVDAACLRCHYFDPNHGPARALELARRHETSDGAYRGDMDRRLERWTQPNTQQEGST